VIAALPDVAPNEGLTLAKPTLAELPSLNKNPGSMLNRSRPSAFTKKGVVVSNATKPVLKSFFIVFSLLLIKTLMTKTFYAKI
jgi:hypothetical protein